MTFWQSMGTNQDRRVLASILCCFNEGDEETVRFTLQR